MSRGDELAPFGTHNPNFMQRVVLKAGELPLLRRGFFRRLLAPVVLALGREPVDIARGAAHYRLYPSSNVAERGIMLNPVYQEQSLSFLRERLMPGSQMVDCGANVGQYSLVSAAIVGPEGKVLAVEATSLMAERLTANIALSGVENIVSVAPVAVGAESGELRFSIDTVDGALSRASETGDTVIACEPLLDLVNQAGLDRIDLLKIDVEGMEDAVLGAFFRDAPESLWPAAMIVEDELAEHWAGDVLPMLTGRGYTVCGRSHGNVFLAREGGG